MDEYTRMEPVVHHTDSEIYDVNYAPMDDANLPPSPSSTRMSSITSQEHQLSVHSQTVSKPVRPSPDASISAQQLIAIPHRRAGWLHKRGRINKKWKLRWCVLKDGHLYYFKTPHSNMQQGHVSLSNYSVDCYLKETRKGAFKTALTHCLDHISKLRSSYKNRTWIFAVPNISAVQGWIKDIEDEIYAYSDSDNSNCPASSQSEMKQDLYEMASDLTVENDASSSDSDYDAPYDDTICSEEIETVKRHSVLSAKLPPKPMVPRFSREIPEAVEETIEDSKEDIEETQSSSPPLPPRLVNFEMHIIPRDADLYSCSWFLEGTSREQAEALLTSYGVFLVRRKTPSATQVISVHDGSSCLHYKIYFVEDRGFTLGAADEKYFPTVVELIHHYQRFALPCKDLCLGKPVFT